MSVRVPSGSPTDVDPILVANWCRRDFSLYHSLTIRAQLLEMSWWWTQEVDSRQEQTRRQELHSGRCISKLLHIQMVLQSSYSISNYIFANSDQFGHAGVELEMLRCSQVGAMEEREVCASLHRYTERPMFWLLAGTLRRSDTCYIPSSWYQYVQRCDWLKCL